MRGCRKYATVADDFESDILELSILPWSSKKVMVFDFTFAVSVFTEAKRMRWITEFRVLAVSVFIEAETIWWMPGLLSIYSDKKKKNVERWLSPVQQSSLLITPSFLSRGAGWEICSLRQRRKMQNTKKRFKSRLPGMKTIDQWTQTGLCYFSEVTVTSFSDRSLSLSLSLSLPLLFLYCLCLLSIYKLETLDCWIIFCQNRGRKTLS